MPDAAQGQLHTRVHDDVVGHAQPGAAEPGIALRPVLLTAVFIVVFAASALAGLHFYYRSEVPGSILTPPRSFPSPRLQQSPESDLAAMLKVQRARLTGYAWIDKDKGVARMPIDEAMRSLAAQGSAAYAAPVQPEKVPVLGSRGGASSTVPSPDGRPGAVRTPASAERGEARR